MAASYRARSGEIRPAYTSPVPRVLAEFRRQVFTPGALSTLSLAALTAAGGLGLPLAWRWRQVLAAAAGQAESEADAILVVGRELEDNQPTAVFRARLDHGLVLFHRRLAPRIVVAGGLTGNASRSEAEAGREHLLAAGAPAESVLCEDQSRHTLENLINTRETLRQSGWSRLIIVSDPLHMARIGAFARGLGLDCQLSPAHQAPPRAGSLGWHTRALREASLLHWYHVGMTYSRAIRSRRLLERVT